MQLQLHYNNSNQFNNYTENSVTINNQLYQNNIMVHNHTIETIDCKDITQLKSEQIQHLVNNNCDLIIFGTSNQIISPNSEIISFLITQRIGYELMTIAALCRTFNFLSAENRKVSAMIFFAPQAIVKL